MTEFETLFGIGPDRVRKFCIIAPFLAKGMLEEFGITKLSRGALYASASTPHLTLIHAGIGAPLAGDAVLYLEQTPCRAVVLLGACGLVSEDQGIEIGSLVTMTPCLAVESFSQILMKDFSVCREIESDPLLIEALCADESQEPVRRVRGATFGSIKLEESCLSFLRTNNVQAVDMECSACFAAARAIGRRAAALLFVTDIIPKKPFFMKSVADRNNSLAPAIRKAVGILKGVASHDSLFI